MLSKSHDVFSVSLNENILKLAHCKGCGSNAKIVGIYTENITGLTSEQVSKTMQAIIKKSKAKNANVFCVLNPSMVTTKNIEVPSSQADEIKSIVTLQASRHTPFSREEIQEGYINLGSVKENFTKVLLVIANKTNLKQQLLTFERSGCKVNKVLFASEGMAAFYGEMLNLKNENAPIGLIDVGQQATEFLIMLRGLPITTRNIPIGQSQLATESETAKQKLVEELSKTIESYQNEDIGEKPSRYILTSNNNHTQDLQAYIQEKLSWSMEILPYENNIKANKKIVEEITIQHADASFLDVISAGIMANATQVDLLPSEVVLQESIAQQGREVFKAGIMGFILLILVAAGFGVRMYFRNAYLHKLKNDFRENRQEVEYLERMREKTMIVRNYLEGRMLALDVIQELYQNIPPEIYLTSLIMDKNGAISIQGVSDVPSLVFNLGADLKESALFKSVNIKSTTAKKDRGKDVSAFEITLKLFSADDEEKKAEEQGVEKAEE